VRRTPSSWRRIVSHRRAGPGVNAARWGALITPHAALTGLVCGVASVALGIGTSLAAAHGELSLLVGGIVAAVTVCVLFAVPVQTLPAITLVATLVIPTDSNLLPLVLQGSALGVVPLAVWLVRARARLQVSLTCRVLAALLAIWMLLSEILAPLHTHRGWAWLATATIGLVLVVTITPAGLNPRRLRSLFLAIMSVLGAYAALEGFVLHRNVLFGPILEHSSWWASLENSVSYRATTLLGHPLLNGTVFAAAAALAASEVVDKPKGSQTGLIRLAILIGAVVATHSRGAAIALGVGLATTIVFARSRQHESGTRRLGLLVSAILGGAVVVAGLQARNESLGGRASAAVRSTVLVRASETLRDLPLTGAGPGQSDAYRTLKRLPGSELALENSYAELAVSTGWVGAGLVIALLGTVVIVGIRHASTTGEAAALLTILVAIAGYNSIEGSPSVLLLIALLVVAILTGAAAESQSTRSGVGAIRPRER